MDAFINILREIYRTRDKRRVDELAPFVHERCAVIGTSLGEMKLGREAFLQLVRDDMTGFVDVEILPEPDARSEGGYTLYTLRALAKCRFTVNEQTYARYAGYMQDIRDSKATPYAKAVKAIWQLDHMLSGKQKVRHREDKPLLISLLEKGGLLCAIMFDFPKSKNHVDCYAGAEPDMDEAYLEDCKAIAGDGALEDALQTTASFNGQRLAQAHAQAVGDVFFGCGMVRNEAALDEELMKDFETLNTETEPYRKVYVLRKRLGETLKLYASGGAQDIMVRFFGILQGGDAKVLAFSYPFYWILED